MPLEASTAREKANIVNIVATRSGCSEVGPIVYLAKTSHPPKLRVDHSRTSGQKREDTDGRQIVESQARGAIAQAPPQAKNTESPGERGLAEGAAEKEEGIGIEGLVSTMTVGGRGVFSDCKYR